MISYNRFFESNRAMSLNAIDKKLSKKYTKIWERASSLMNIEFESEPVDGDNDKYIKTKINLFGNKVNANFQDRKIPKENSS